MDSWDLALILAIVSGLVRIFAVAVGLWYQSLVTWDRYEDKRALCADAEAPPVECAIAIWHFERGVLLLGVHALLAILTVIATWGRARMSPPHDLDTATLMVRAGSDLTFTTVVVLLAVVSYRAHVHHMRQLRLLQTLEEQVHAGTQVS